MSGLENTAGTTARASAELQESLADLSLPAIKEALAAWTADLGRPGQKPSSIRAAFGDLRAGMKEDFADNRERSAAYIKQQALQSGTNYSPQAMSETMSQLGSSLRSSEAQQMRAVNFQEAQAGLTQTNSLLSNITGTAGSTLSGAMRFGGNTLQSDQLLQQYEQQQRQQNSQWGAYAGTAIGALLAPYTGGISLPIGTAAGTAIGGIW